MINFAQHIIELNKERAEKIAIIDGIQETSYGQMASRIQQVASNLIEMGLSPGQNIIITMEDCVDWPVAFLGCIYAGAIPIPVAANITKEIFNDIIDFVDCRMMFIDDARFDQFRHKNIPLISRSHMLRLYSTPTSGINPIMVHPDAPGYMGLSSGSTGLPKIAVFRHQILFDIVKLVPQALYGMDSSSIMMSLPKMSWGYGLHNTITYTMGVGGTAVVIPGPPNPTTVFQMMQKYRPTIVASTPAVIKKLLGPASKKYSIPTSVVRVQSSGESLPDMTYNEFYERFGIKISTSIGQLEVANTHYATTNNNLSEQGTVGKALPGVTIKIIDKQDQECKQGIVGEIHVRSKMIASYYLKNYNTTKNTFFGHWVKTGDTGYIDSAGNLIFVGRVDDVFKVNDLIVSPVDIENEILKYPGIENVAIVGVKKDANTQVHAFVIPTDCFDADQFDQFLNSKLLKHQLPKKIHMVAQFPETVTGKKDRKTLGSLVNVD